MRLLLALMGAALLLSACRRELAYHAYRSTPMEGWEQGDTLHFHVDTLRRTGTYAMSLGVRSSASTPYPFQTLWLVKARGSSSASSSPAMAQKPPMGTARRE